MIREAASMGAFVASRVPRNLYELQLTERCHMSGLINLRERLLLDFRFFAVGRVSSYPVHAEVAISTAVAFQDVVYANAVTSGGFVGVAALPLHCVDPFDRSGSRAD